MNDVVVDASILVKPFIREAGWEIVAAHIRKMRVWGPELMRYEIPNVIIKRLRENGQPADVILRMLSKASKLRIHHVPRETWEDTAMKLASTGSLTYYDASYVALASVRNLPLWSRDRQMKEAAANSKVPLYEP